MNIVGCLLFGGIIGAAQQRFVLSPETRAFLGVMRMRDEKGIDDKIVAVSVRDPSFADYSSKDQLPAHVLRQVRRFFEDYKVLEHKQVVVEDMLGPEDALKIILEAMELYRKLRAGELK